MQARPSMLRVHAGRPWRRLCTSAVAVRSRTEECLRGNWKALDPQADGMLARLRQSEAPLVWHKHGTFLEHLRDVWVMLCAWEQPQAWCRLGLFHSAYSNSFVSMGIFDRDKDRSELAKLIGDEAENLVYKFCTVDRQTLESTVLADGTIRSEGYTMEHIGTGEKLRLSGREAAAMVCETLADELEQRFGWQSDLEAGKVRAVWPGSFPPTLRLGRTSRLAAALRASEQATTASSLPPIFEHCSRVLREEEEVEAREAYMMAVNHMPSPLPMHGGGSGGDAWRRSCYEALTVCMRSNPFVGEPHLVVAQLYLEDGQWEEAERCAVEGTRLLEVFATSWDKRMSWQAWLNWGRCLCFQARMREWPTTHGGIESLGAVSARQRVRGLNTGRSMSG